MQRLIGHWLKFEGQMENWLRYPEHAVMLLLRLFLAWIFFKSGLLKIQSWDSTLELFSYEYAVPVLSPKLAAIMGTAAELALPPLLALGLMTRPAALALFAVNVVAAISYPDISPAGIKDHQLWGLGFLWIFLAGGGAVSLDAWLSGRCSGHRPA
jgi:putative oxidoreductase